MERRANQTSADAARQADAAKQAETARTRVSRRRQADAQRLGPVVAVYRAGRITPGEALWVFLPGILAVLAPLGYGLLKAQYAYTHFGPVAAEFWSRPWYQLSTAALSVFALLLFYRWLARRGFVAVHRGGLHLRLGRIRSQTLAWNEIAGLTTAVTREQFLGRTLATRQEATLVPHVGRPVRLKENLENLPELVTRIKASLYPRLLPRLLVAYQAGQPLYFGPLRLDRQALTVNERTYPWRQVRRLGVQAGSLVIELDSHSPSILRLPVAKIPNFELILQIIQQGVNA